MIELAASIIVGAFVGFAVWCVAQLLALALSMFWDALCRPFRAWRENPGTRRSSWSELEF